MTQNRKRAQKYAKTGDGRLLVKSRKSDVSHAGVRVNLTVPKRVDASLAELAALLGRSKASLVLEMLMANADFVRRRVRFLRDGVPMAAPWGDARGKKAL